jgi:uncharacterized protein YdaU (DUF1376 family)
MEGAVEHDYVPDYSGCTLPYVQWYQDDFAGGVRGMRAHEIGIYTMMLMEMYARGRALDMSEDRLARLCGAERRTFAKALEMLISEGKIIRLDCGLWNERCENAFKERAKMQQLQMQAGQSSAEKRKENKANKQRPLNARSTSVQPISEAQTLSKKEGSYEPLSAPKVADPVVKPGDAEKYPADFEAAWRAFPTDRNMSKAEAFPEWKKLSASDKSLVLPSIPSFIAYCKSNPDYRPIHFVRYLKFRRFEAGSLETHPSADDATWAKRLTFGRVKRSWSTGEWGPAPGLPGCLVPAALLQPGDGDGWAEFQRDAA